MERPAQADELPSHVNTDQIDTAATGRKCGVTAVLREGLLVAIMGAGLAFAANALSPRGLALARNYFPGATVGVSPSTHTNAPPITGSATNAVPPGPAELAVERLRSKGLQVVAGPQAAEMFRDARYEQELIIFVDARDDEHYQAGHIPGAFQFDHYHPDKYLAAIVPACQAAQQIVVYCNGGDCEDSEFAALTLREMGTPNEKLFVFAGGIKEWEASRLPVEVGARRSGNIRSVEK